MKPPRRAFQLYCLSSLRTGVFVLREVFKEYRFLRDFQIEKAEELQAARQRGRMSSGELMRYIRRRDRDGMLEVDASHVHSGWMDLLPRMFPESRYLLTVRDCYSWLDATLNQLLEVAKEPRERRRMAAVSAGRGSTLLDVFRSPEALAGRFELVADRYLSLWAEVNRGLLAGLPAGRSLVVPVDGVAALLPRVPEIARLIGVPPETLSTRFPSLPAPVRHGVLARVDPALVEAARRRHCEELMARFFPGRALAGFLAAAGRAG